MKKWTLSILILGSFLSKTQACAWYDPDYDYFNLFTQSIITNKSYLPFLLTYSNPFYSDSKTLIPDENITAWQKFFKGRLSYSETVFLVEKLSIAELNAYKKSGKTNAILQKIGTFSQNQEAIDYLIEAKYLEPFMRINYVESPDSFYYPESENKKNATQLDYEKTVAALKSLFQATKNPEIKLRYAFQLVRFNHYSRKYREAISAFQTFVEPLKLRTAPYFMALNQLAGAQRGLAMKDEANWNFFQVFMHSNRAKENAFVSMKLTDSASFNNLLQRAQNKDEMNMAYFLLGYQDFNNPLPMMQKMAEIDPNSEILKVLAARAVNELERNYLPIFYSENLQKKTSSIPEKAETKTEKISWWMKIVTWFRNLFKKKQSSDERNDQLSDRQYLENPNRIPFLNHTNTNEKPADFLKNFEDFTEKITTENDDVFWKITEAYLKFLNKEYDESSEILTQIKTQNPDYNTQIQRLKMLNDVVSKPKIDAEFENYLSKKYPEFLSEKKPKNDSITDEYGYSMEVPSTKEFMTDILANRYFLQGDDAKSFLMSNTLGDLRFNPDVDLAKKLQAFINKEEKNDFEKNIVQKNAHDVGDTEAFFNMIYGDFAMKNANFEQAKKHYEKAVNFSGIPLPEGDYNEAGIFVKYDNPSKLYNGFGPISSLIFGTNSTVSYSSFPSEVMQPEDFISEFPTLKPEMNKLELANTAIELKNIGNSKSPKAAKANQLLGNLLYNTSILGYFREIFVMDRDNSNGGKYNFTQEKPKYQVYYKNFAWHVFAKPEPWTISQAYYEKALQGTTDHEQQAKILFQLASIEQGKYYQWEVSQPEIPYTDDDWLQKRENQETIFLNTKNQKFKTYFARLKQNYAQSQTAKSLMSHCLYFDFYMKK